MSDQTKSIEITTTTVELDSYITEVAYDAAIQPLTLFDILGVPKAELFMALYNAANVVDHHYYKNITLVKAKEITEGYSGRCCWVDGTLDFTIGGHDVAGQGNEVTSDGLFMGRAMNIDISGDEMDTTAYDVLNGEGKAEAATKTLLAALDGERLQPKSLLARAFHRALGRED